MTRYLVLIALIFASTIGSGQILYANYDSYENDTSYKKKKRKKKHRKKKQKKRKKTKAKLRKIAAPHLKEAKNNVMRIKRPDINVFFGGRIREDFFFFDRPISLDKHFGDQAAYFRHKLELSWHALQGLETYGKPATEGFAKISSYSWWQSPAEEGIATDKVPVYSVSNNGLGGVQLGEKHTHKLSAHMIYTEDAWLAVHFGTLFKPFKNYPTTLKAGFFPYILGRGLSLGFHEDMALTYAGWQGDNGRSRFPYMPPGVLLTGAISPNLSWDLYFNRWRDSGIHPEDIFDLAHADRLAGPRPHRGSWKSWDTWAFKLNFKHQDKAVGNLKIEPYTSYTRAPEQPVEFEVDAKSHLGTVGVMADYTKNNWNVNVEVAGQFGHQTLFEIDRNRIKIERDKTTGAVHEQFSHIVLNGPPGSPLNNSKAFVRNTTSGEDLLVAANYPHNRRADAQGRNLRNNTNNADLQVNINGVNYNLRNADQMLGGKRFRPQYKLNYQGMMAMADVAYTFENHPFKIAASAAYIGGDTYPYNEEKNRSYKAFIAQRGAYWGHHVMPVYMLERLVISRPMNIVERTLYAENHYRDYSNIQYLGAAGTWFPLKNNKQQMSLNSNLLFYWVVSDMKKWDNNGTHPDPAKEAEIARLRQALQFKGWMSDQNANKFLGTEWNVIFNYLFTSNCNFYFKGFTFLPGQLYKDLAGQPNRFTRKVDVAANGQLQPHYHGLGSDLSWGFYTGIDFKF